MERNRRSARLPMFVAPVFAACLLFSSAFAYADASTDWNARMQTTVASVNPFLQARTAAIVQLAVFEAVNSITGDYEAYLQTVPAPAGASPEAAAIAAAHRALVTLHPGSAATLDAARATSLAAIADGQAKDDGIKVGEIAADIILALRTNDGSSAVVAYTPGTQPGDWQPTPPALAPAFLPGWGKVATFGIENGAQFRSSPPPAVHTGKYARDYNEVKEVGHVTSEERGRDLTDVARFYIISAVQVYNPAARQVSAAQRKSLSENARTFALLNMAICDGLISAMETKYYYNYWRPVTAIRAGNTDGNQKTDPNPDWLPLVATPAFPSYPSAHASAGGAAREVLEDVYGEGPHDISLTSPTAPGVTLKYTAWEQITDDIDDARVFGGIHFRFDQEAGARQGRRAGSYILRNHLRPVSTVAR